MTGVKADLEQCLARLQSPVTDAPLILRGRQISSVLQIPEKLYGREEDLRVLMQCYNRVRLCDFNGFVYVSACVCVCVCMCQVSMRGRSEAIMVSGGGGSGKSRLITELFAELTISVPLNRVSFLFLLPCASSAAEC